MKFSLLFFLIFSSNYAFADAGHFSSSHKKGFHIFADNIAAKNVGDSLIFDGKFCFWKMRGDGGANPKCDLVKSDSFEVKAFYPDAFSEIPVTINRVGHKKEYAYHTPPQNVEAGRENVFSLFVFAKGRFPSNLHHLQKTKSKIERRLHFLVWHRAKMIEEEKPAEVIARYDEKIAGLEQVITKINHAINQRPEILARLDLPVQVGNTNAGRFSNYSFYGGYRVGIEGTPGANIEGGKSIVTASISNLSAKDIFMPEWENNDDDDDDDSNNGRVFYYKILQNGNTTYQSNPSSLAFDETWSYQFSTPKLSINNGGVHQLVLKLIKYEVEDGFVKQSLWGQVEGDINVTRDQTAPVWVAPILPNVTDQYAQNFPAIRAALHDDFGQLDPDSVKLSYSGQLNDNSLVNGIVNSLQLQLSEQNRTLILEANANPLAEGLYTLFYEAKDLAGNLATPTNISRTVRVDRTPPAIFPGISDNLLTNIPILNLPISVVDFSPTTTTVFHNNNLVFTTDQIVTNPQINLNEGLNGLRIESVDAAGNHSPSIQFSFIELDTIPPVLSEIAPANNSIVNNLSLTVSGKSSEKLLRVLINGQEAILSLDKKSFSLLLAAPSEGLFNIAIEAHDLAGNRTETNRQVEIILRVLNQELIAINPAANGGLDIEGLSGAARPGITVTAKVGLFSQQSVSANSDGSFLFNFPLFSSVTLSATDQGRTDQFTLSYNVDTTFSGKVCDYTGAPLPGVTVRIDSSSQSSITNALGIFAIPNAVTGDQMVTIDGTTIPLSVSGPNKKFQKSKIAVSIGVSQSNVLERPIFLTPLMFDGTETSILNGAATVVTSSHAPGLEIDIPAGAVQFPGGSNSGSINAIEITANAASIPALEYAVPETVYALEPSGLTFNTPVELTLPNVNNIPAGVQMVILSKDSLKGIWAIDGVARVSEDGSSIVTEPGMGITHFSEVYAAPLGPTVKQIGAQDIPGSDLFNGALSTAISLPTYKSLGRDIAAGLAYRSNWAHPTLMVTNLFDVPKNEVAFTPFSAGARSLFGRANVSVSGTAWIEPNFITAEFSSGDIYSGKMTFTGVPNQSVISYGMDLSNVESGLYPYLSHYEIHLNQIIFGTRTTVTKKLFGKTRISQERFKETRELEQVFPQDIGGPLYVQNKKQSEAGTGWKIIGPQTIVNPGAPRIMIEEADGGIASYALKDTIDTVFSSSSGLRSLQFIENGGATQSIDYIDNSNILRSRSMATSSTNTVYSSYPTDYQPRIPYFMVNLNADWTLGYIYNPGLSGHQRFDFGFKNGQPRVSINRPLLKGPIQNSIPYSAWRFGPIGGWIPRNVQSVVKLPNNKYLMAENQHQLYLLDNGSLIRIAGQERTVPEFVVGKSNPIIPSGYPDEINCPNVIHQLNPDNGAIITTYNVSNPLTALDLIFQLANNNDGLDAAPRGCFNQFSKELFGSTFGGEFIGNFSTIISGSNKNKTFQNQFLDHIYGPSGVRKSGIFPLPGFGEGTLGSNGVNDPKGLAVDTNGNVYLADSGNNRVRKININNYSLSTIAGNGQTLDSGDGGLATNASLFHPRGLAFDNQGNLYVSTERGLIRKIDTLGNISTFAGKINGTFADSAPALEMRFNNPYGMVVDNDHGYLYIADTGNHRIVRVDFLTKTAVAVAGSGSCQQGAIGDGGQALNASLCNPQYVGLDADNNLLIADMGHNSVRRVTFGSESDITGNQALSYAPTILDNSKLERLSDGSYVRSFRNGAKSYFNNQGRQIRSLDRVGLEVHFQYDGSGRLISQRDPVGKLIQYQYTGGKLSAIQDPAGRQTSFDYDGDVLSQVNFPDGTARSFSYDAKGLLVSETNQRQFSTNYFYNLYNRLVRVVRPDNSVVEVSDAISGTAGNSFVGGSVGQLKKFGSGQDDANNKIKDARGIETTFNQDTDGFVTAITDGLGQVTKIERNLHGDPTKIIRPDGSFVTFVYDIATRDLLSRTDSATNSTISFSYNAFGQVVSEENLAGVVTTHSYDPFTGLELEVRNDQGQFTTRTYQAYGLLKDISNVLGQKTAFEYFPDGNLKARIAADLSRTDFVQDLSGNVVQVTNAKGQVINREYDLWNRLTAVVSAKNERTEYSYLATGELSQTKDPYLKVVNYDYNNLGQLIKKTDQLGFETRLIYDPNGNVAQEIDPNGNVKTFSYDNLDRLIRKALPDNVYEFEYDVKNNLTVAKNNITELEFEYIETAKGDQVSLARTRGLGVKSNYPEYQLEFDFDQRGNRTVMTTAVGNFSYDYDILDRLIGVTNHKGESFDFNFDLANRLTSLVRPSGMTSFSFDNTNFLTSIMHKKGAAIIKDLIYERDAIGNRTKMSVNSLDYLFDYDQNNQLIEAVNPEVGGNYSNELFDYDAIGNRSEDEFGLFSYDQSRQRLNEDARYYYFYDNNGNLSSKQSKAIGAEVHNYVYSSENQLIGYELFQNNVLKKSAQYFYNAIGQRVEKVVNDVALPSNSFTRRYVYHDNELLHELDQSNTILSTYTHSGLRTDDTLAVDISALGANAGLALAGGTYYFLKDGLGSITDITNSGGDIVQKFVYSSFGKILSIKDGNNQDISNSPTVAPYFTYTNREFDAESNLYYYRARYYDSSIGRFLQQDPHPGNQDSPNTTHNRSIYANNNSLNFVDPDGTFSFRKGLGWTIAIASPPMSFLIMNSTDFFQDEFSFTSKDEQKYNIAVIMAAAIAVGVATGGTAGPAAEVAVASATSGYIGATAASITATISSYIAAAAVGATFGAISGAFLGATIAILRGEDIEKGSSAGGRIGFYSGAAGGIIGASLEVGLSENAGIGKAVSSRWYSFAGASLLIPIKKSFTFPIY